MAHLVTHGWATHTIIHFRTIIPREVLSPHIETILVLLLTLILLQYLLALLEFIILQRHPMDGVLSVLSRT